MNKVMLMGRFSKDPETRYSQGENTTAISRFSLAVDRRIKRDGDANVDFINCVSFGKTAEFIEKYMKKGTKISLVGRIQTGSYTNKDGVKIYTTDIVVEEIEFAESKKDNNSTPAQDGNSNQPASATPTSGDGFMNIPEGLDEELPFNF